MLNVSLVDAAAAGAPTDLLVVPVFSGLDPGPGAEEAAAALGTPLRSLLEAQGFGGKVGEAVAVPTLGRLAATTLLVVGLGDRDQVGPEALRRKADAGQGQAPELRRLALAVEGDQGQDQDQALETALAAGAVRAAATNLARDLSNEPANALHPSDLAEAARAAVEGKGVRVTVKDEQQLRREGFGGIIGVGQGADHPPRLIELRYEPEGARGHVILVGKGITFDSGGLSLKPPDGMVTMKTDMSGAAAVVGVLSAVADLGVRVAVTGYLASAENMPSGSATRPGDVLTMKNGTTVEVLNTDAEGRLVMADALALGAASEPDAIIDVATLTGACMVALGKRITGLFSNDDALAAELLAAADEAGEKSWRLPVPEEYHKELESEIADLKNVGERWGGALTAALFLQEFVDGRPWAHLDIAGPARAESQDGYLGKGSTGAAVRTLLTWLEYRST